MKIPTRPIFFCGLSEERQIRDLEIILNMKNQDFCVDEKDNDRLLEELLEYYKYLKNKKRLKIMGTLKNNEKILKN